MEVLKMNNYLMILDKFKDMKNIKNQELKELENTFDKLYDGLETIKERVEARKANEKMIDEITSKMADAQNDIKIIENCIKITQEMIAKETANDILKAFQDGKKNLINTPTHYKKFEKALDEVLNGAGGYISHEYYTVYYKTPYYSPAGNQEIYICSTDNCGGVINQADAQKTKLYELIPANEILKTVNKAMAAKAKIDKLEKETKAKIDEIKEGFVKSNALYNILR